MQIPAPLRGEPYVAFGTDTVQVTATSARTEKSYELSLKLHKSIKKPAFSVDALGRIYLTMRKQRPNYWHQLLLRKPTGSLKRAIEVDWANWVDEEDMSSEDDDIDEDDVHVLRDDNFDRFIEANPLTLVEFYAPWCGHCKSLKPEYAKAATQLKERGVPCKLAKLDGSKHGKVASRFGVKGFPALKVFRGSIHSHKDLEVSRDAHGIVEGMTKLSRPAVVKLSDLDAVKKFAGDMPPKTTGCVMFHSAGSPSEKFQKIAEELQDDYVFASVEGDASEFGVNGTDEVLLFKPYSSDKEIYGDETQLTYPHRKLELAEFKHWMLLNTLPLVPDLSKEPEHLEKLIKRQLPIVYLFADDEHPERDSVIEAGRKLSKAFHGRYSIASYRSVCNGDTDKALEMGIKPTKIPDPNATKPEDWNDEEDGPWVAPEIPDIRPMVAIDAVGGGLHHVLPWERRSKGITYSVLEQFLNDHDECMRQEEDGHCKLARSIRSQEPPKSNHGVIKEAVGTTFDDIVTNNPKDVLVEFYAPWCGHCKALAPKYAEVAEKLKRSKNLLVAKIDASQNDVPSSKFELQGFPTLYLKPASDSRKGPARFEGAREVQDIIAFVRQYAHHPIVEA